MAMTSLEEILSNACKPPHPGPSPGVVAPWTDEGTYDRVYLERNGKARR